MNLFFSPNGVITCLYSEEIPLLKIGRLNIKRFTKVEPNQTSTGWQVKNMKGKILFSDPSKQTCLWWEEKYFNERMRNATY
jgi:hypothetical protein